jgi:magnesium transporter
VRVLRAIDDGPIDEACASDEFFWIDLEDPTDEAIARLGERFDWHPLAVEDLQSLGQRPKLESYGDYVVMFFFGARAGDDGLPDPVEVGLVVSGSYVVTVRRAGPELDALRARLEARPSGEEQWVVYAILDTLTDTFFPGLAATDERIDELERAIVERPHDEQLTEILELKRTLTDLRRIVVPQRDLTARAMGQLEDIPGLDPASRDWFRDVYDHLIRVGEQIDSYRDLLTSTMDVYLSTVSMRLNEVIRKLTVVATVFLPLTVVTSFFGQNFAWLENHIHSLGAFLVFGIGGIAVSLGILYGWFRSAGLNGR